MQQTEQRLGFRPRFGTFDAACDAFYVYEFFHCSGDPSAFAAVPFSEKGGYKNRKFSPEGLPICEAGLAMPLLFTYTDRTVTIIEHERGKYICSFFSKKRQEQIHQTVVSDALQTRSQERLYRYHANQHRCASALFSGSPQPNP